MFQRVSMKITPRTLKFDVNEQLVERAYTFQMRIKSHKLDYESQMAPNFIVFPQQKWLKKRLTKESQNYGQINVGDLQLFRDNKKFEINELYGEYDHDTNMDECVRIDKNRYFIAKEKCQIQLNDRQIASMKKSLSNQNLSQANLQIQNFSRLTHSTQDLNFIQKKVSQYQHQNQIFRSSTKDQLTAIKVLNWQFKSDAPTIEFNIYVDEFVSSSFELVLWINRRPQELQESQSNESQPPSFKRQTSNNNPQKQQGSDSLSSDDSQNFSLDYKLLGHCFISMNRFCSKDASLIAQMDRMIVQEIHFNEQLQKHGLAIGNVKGDFIMTNSPFLRQTMGLLKTEYGIQKATLLNNKKHKYMSRPNQQIEKILQINNKLDQLVSDANSVDLPKRVVINEQIKETIIELKQQLSLSLKDVQYSNEDELRKAQYMMIELCKKLLESADMLDEEFREQYYEILISLIHRQEFHLSYLGFDKKKREINQERLQIGIHYQNFIYRTLQHVVTKIQQRGLNQKENQFIYNFFVIAYFRIPELRTSVYNFLEQDQRVLNAHFEKDLIEPQPQFMIQNDYFLSTLDWKEQFYNFICKEERGQQHLEELMSILNEINWNKIVNKQNHVFLNILTHICLNLQRSRHRGFIPWSHIPGYGLFVRYFLLELKEADQFPYPEVYKQVSSSLLENESLINYFLFVIYNKTKIYDSLQVFYTFDMINFWFTTLKNMNKKLPTDFSYHFFFKGVGLIFEGDHALSIAKVIQVFYNIFPQLPNEYQHEFCDHLFEKFFFRFFMNWSKTVRWVFHQFLIYRIQHLFRNQRTDVNKIQDIQKDLQFYYNRQGGSPLIQQKKEKLLNDMIYLKFTQMIDIVLKMKKVIIKNANQQDAQLKAHLEARSLRMKFIKMKLRKQKRRQSSESPGHGSLDFTLQSQKESLNSLSLRRESQQSLQDFQNDSVFDEQQQIQSNFLDQEINYEEQSLGSIINLDQILQEIAEDKLQKKMRAQRAKQRNNSVKDLNEINENNTPDLNTKNKKVTIFHKMNYYTSKRQKLQIPRELLKYLVVAMNEWQEQQAIYKRWCQQKRNELLRLKLPENEIIKRLTEIEPPEINLRVPKDESESNTDW